MKLSRATQQRLGVAIGIALLSLSTDHLNEPAAYLRAAGAACGAYWRPKAIRPRQRGAK